MNYRKKIIFLYLVPMARLVLGIVFLYASYDKILHPAAFAASVYNYHILPDIFINITAIVLPWLELALGGFLVMGIWLEGSVVMSSLLLILFMGAMLFNMARGLNIHCGCFSAASQGTMDIWTVLRDFAFLFVSLFLTIALFWRKAYDHGNH